MKKLLLTSLLCAILPAHALNVKIELEIPEIKEANYHKPYVASWIENSDKKLVDHLFVWYKLSKKDPKQGVKWLRDLRNWWRKGGRALAPIPDAIAGATPKVGTHTVEIKADDARLAKLKDGHYTLHVEAAREEGGLEVVAIPFTLPLKETATLTANGKEELGKITLTLTP